MTRDCVRERETRKRNLSSCVALSLSLFLFLPPVFRSLALRSRETRSLETPVPRQAGEMSVAGESTAKASSLLVRTGTVPAAGVPNRVGIYTCTYTHKGGFILSLFLFLLRSLFLAPFRFFAKPEMIVSNCSERRGQRLGHRGVSSFRRKQKWLFFVRGKDGRDTRDIYFLCRGDVSIILSRIRWNVSRSVRMNK